MKVLLITQYYLPETFKSTEIAEELVKRGHSVDALVGIPNYPEGKYYKGYGLFRKRREVVNGVNIYRCFQTPRGTKASAIGLSFNYISFVVSSVLWVLFFFSWRKKYDVIIAHEPSPITQIIPAILLSKIRKTPVYSWVLDIWPDSMIMVYGGKSRFRFIENTLSSLTEWVYKNSNMILVSSKGMMSLVNRNNDYSSKLVYFPNWCEDILQLPHQSSISLPDGFKIMMAGNINTGTGVDAVINLILGLKDTEDLFFVFVGGGTKEQYLRETLANKGIKNVLFTGRLPFSQMPSLYEQADAMFLSLQKTTYPHLKATVPARLQSYLSAGKPILAMIDGCCADIINQAECGFAAAAGDYEDLSRYIKEVVLLDKAAFKKKGLASRSFFEKYYQKEGCISNLEYYLEHKETTNPPYCVPTV